MKNIFNSINKNYHVNINLWVEDWIEQIDYLKNDTETISISTPKIYVMV